MGAATLPEESGTRQIPSHVESKGALLRIPPQAHTLAEFRRWALSDAVPEKLPLALIKGEVYVDMSKEEIGTHALVKTAVGGGLFQLNEEIDFGHLFINGVLVTNVIGNVSNNPDLAAVSYRSLKVGRVRYIENKGRVVEIEGSPDVTAAPRRFLRNWPEGQNTPEPPAPLREATSSPTPGGS